MERTDYPAIPTTISHHASLNALRDRLHRVQLLNTEIADWIAERRKVEEAYVLGLQKLCKRPSPNEASELGAFLTPWQRIVSSTASLATSHHVYSQKLETEVERPVREFAASNKEWVSLRTMEGNLTSLSKAIDTSEEKVEKLKKKGKRAEPSKVAEATSGLKDAQGNWESQSPFIFEQLQAVDEARVTHLRESLTRMQTLELDQTDQVKSLMEATVQALLDVNTSDEIKSYANRVCGGKAGSITSRPGSQRARQGPIIQTPSIVTDDSVSVQSSGSAEKGSHGLGGGLRRLGTVLKGRNRNSAIFPSYSHSPVEHRSSNDRLGLGFGKGSAFGSHSPNNSSHNLSVPSAETPSSSREHQPEPTEIQVTVPQSPKVASPSSPIKPEPPTPTAASSSNQITTDSEGYSVPPPQKSLVDDIPDAESHEIEQAPAFKLEIRNDVIPEEETEAADAMTKVATTLRAQQTVSKRNRGRRDVRNTIYGGLPDATIATIATTATTSTAAPTTAPTAAPIETNGASNPTQPSDTGSPSQPPAPPAEASPSLAPAPPTFSPTATDSGTPLTGNTINHHPLGSPFTPLKMIRQSTLASDAGSDTQSIMSGLSATSQGAQSIKHPSLNEPGFSASMIEHISAQFEAGHASKVVVIGEIALANNAVEGAPSRASESLRFDQYGMMEKISLNQSHISMGSQTGEYLVSLTNLRGTAVSFRYQLKMDEASMQSYPPLIVIPTWKLENHQASLILSYKPNPLFNNKNSENLFSSPTLRNLVFITGVEGVQATSCQSKPSATFFKDRSRIAWRIPEVKLGDEAGGKLIARLFTDGLAKPMPVEARWEIFGSDDIKSAGSGVGIEVLKAVEVEKDPFADDTDDGADSRGEWKEVHTVRKLVSGKYFAS
ncbi:hypothetical protein ABW19_dt0205305 [Dactylella cylindrospora]|nr:hypothetical protein ABW19_dt0205305 [Dactylella cylindrospora]